MPQRTNEFQQLIRDVYTRVSGTATVSESKMVPDADGTLRELDLAIEFEQGVHKVVVAVECTDRTRSVGAPWIEGLYGKYRDLPVSEVVAVARSFTAPARAKAKRLGIRAVEFREVRAGDWYSKIRRAGRVELEVAGYRIVSYKVHLASRVPPSYFEHNRVGQMEIQAPSGQRATVEEFAKQRKMSPEAREGIEREYAKLGCSEFTVRIELTGWTLLGPGAPQPLRELEMKIERTVTKGSTALKHATFGNVAVAYGSAKVGKETYRVTLAEAESDASAAGSGSERPEERGRVDPA